MSSNSHRESLARQSVAKYTNEEEIPMTDQWFAAYSGDLTREQFDQAVKALEDNLIESLVHGVGNREDAWDKYFAAAGCSQEDAMAVFYAVDDVTPVT